MRNRNIRALQGIRETEISRRIISRIAAEDDQHVHFAGAHVIQPDSFRDSVLVDRIGIHRIGIENRLANITKGMINGVGKGVDFAGG